MICLRTTDDWFEAHILRGLLEAHDIPAQVLGEAIVRMNWLQAQALGGYRLCTDADHADRAFDVLEAWQRGELDDGGTPVCANCGGREFALHRANGRRAAFAGILLLGVPLPLAPGEDRWVCSSCDAVFTPS